MTKISTHPIRTVAREIMLGLVIAATAAFAQELPEGPPPAQPPAQQQAPAPTPGWQRFASPPPSQSQQPGSNPAGPQGSDQQNQPLPSRLTVKAGTYVTVRVNQFLSSDRNQAGDTFTGTFVQPLVADGVIVAQRGETVYGRVAEAQKAGRVKGVSRLALELTSLTLVDGQQVPVRTTLASRKGPTSEGRDALAIGGSTGVGAAIGATVAPYHDIGEGAAIGAGAGALAATIGVLLTRGRPTLVYPESVLAFEIQAPVTISTDAAPQAFRYVESNDYERSSQNQGPPAQGGPGGPPCQGYGCPPPPYYGSPYYGYPYYGPPYYPYYPYYWGAGLSFYFGPGFFYGPRFFGRGFVFGRGFFPGRGFSPGRGFRR